MTSLKGLFQRLSGESEKSTEYVNRGTNRAPPEYKLEALLALRVISIGLSYCDCLTVIMPCLWHVYKVCHSVSMSGRQPVGRIFSSSDFNLPLHCQYSKWSQSTSDSPSLPQVLAVECILPTGH